MLDEFVKQLRHQGKLDSHGTFTVDVKVPLEKLLDIRHARADLFLRHILGMAVALGATAMRVEANAARWSVEVDGVVLLDWELRELFYFLSGHEEGERAFGLRELALALATLAGTPELRADLDCSAGRLTIGNHRIQIRPGQGRVEPLQLKVRTQGWGPFGKALPALDLGPFRRAACCAPLRLAVNGSRPVVADWGSCSAVYRLQGLAPMPPVRMEAWNTRLERGHDGDYSLLIGLWPADGGCSLDIVDRGLIFSGQDGCWLFPCRVLLSGPGLPRDVLGRQLLAGPKLLELQQRVVEHTVELVRQLEMEFPNCQTVIAIREAVRSRAGPLHPAWASWIGRLQ